MSGWRQRTEHMPCADLAPQSMAAGVHTGTLQHVAYVGNLRFSHPTTSTGHGNDAPALTIGNSARRRSVRYPPPRCAHANARSHGWRPDPVTGSIHLDSQAAILELICYLRQASARATYPTSTTAATKGRQAACRTGSVGLGLRSSASQNWMSGTCGRQSTTARENSG